MRCEPTALEVNQAYKMLLTIYYRFFHAQSSKSLKRGNSLLCSYEKHNNNKMKKHKKWTVGCCCMENCYGTPLQTWIRTHTYTSAYIQSIDDSLTYINIGLFICIKVHTTISHCYAMLYFHFRFSPLAPKLRAATSVLLAAGKSCSAKRTLWSALVAS